MVTTISLRESVRNVVRQCARVRPGELVCVAADTQTMPIALAIVEAVKEAGAEPVLVTMLPRRAHGNEPPRVVAAAMKAADVVIQPVTYAMTHTDATRDALRAGARVLVLRGVTEDIMTRGAMLADYDKIERVTKEVARLLTEARTARVRTPAGTDLTLSLDGRAAVALTGRSAGQERLPRCPTAKPHSHPSKARRRGRSWSSTPWTASGCWT